MVTITTEVDVEVDVSDFDTDELRDELESRGYHVSCSEYSIDEISDRELIGELNDRGYTTYGKKADLAWELYQAYLLDDDMGLRKYVARILRENGYRP
jgi:hypothetical protein